jgi:four helix bundle protein
MKDFRNLLVWQKSHQLTLEIYRVTKSFPKEETYGLTSQMRRSSSSIPTNIAEGCGRQTNADFSRFLQIGFGSSSEIEYQILLSRDLKFLADEEYAFLNGLVIEIKKMLASLINKIRNESGRS